MQSAINTPISLLISLSVLCGWFISDFRIGEALNTIVALPINRGAYLVKEAIVSPVTSSPNIDSNWFSGSPVGMSYQLPSAQARKTDDDERIAQGGTMGESFGNNDDF